MKELNILNNHSKQTNSISGGNQRLIPKIITKVYIFVRLWISCKNIFEAFGGLK